MVPDTALFTVRAYNTSLMRASKKTKAKYTQIEIGQFFGLFLAYHFDIFFNMNICSK